MKKFLYLALAAAALLTGCDKDEQAKIESVKAKPKSEMKAIVVYFSATGTTRAKAETLAKLAEADIYEIVPANLYTSADLNWHNDKSRSSVEMADKSSRPAISGKLENLADYDVVFLGFPIWWYIAPTIVNTFLEAHNFDGKIIIPFFTSGGSGAGETLKYLKPSAPKAVFTDPKNLTGASNEEIQAWLDSLKK